MESNIFKLIIKSVGYTILAVIISYFGIGRFLGNAFDYTTVEATYHIITYALLIGLMFTIIFCTTLILDKLKNK